MSTLKIVTITVIVTLLSIIAFTMPQNSHPKIEYPIQSSRSSYILNCTLPSTPASINLLRGQGYYSELTVPSDCSEVP